MNILRQNYFLNTKVHVHLYQLISYKIETDLLCAFSPFCQAVNVHALRIYVSCVAILFVPVTYCFFHYRCQQSQSLKGFSNFPRQNSPPYICIPIVFYKQLLSFQVIHYNYLRCLCICLFYYALNISKDVTVFYPSCVFHTSQKAFSRLYQFSIFVQLFVKKLMI